MANLLSGINSFIKAYNFIDSFFNTVSKSSILSIMSKLYPLSDKVDFILFDVAINGVYQPRDSVKDIANYFNIDLVPTILIGTIQEAIDFVKTKPMSKIGKAKSEGLVGRPLQELNDRRGNRIIVKIKVCDFE